MTETTPRITAHAAQRCAEMGISTKVAKCIARNPAIMRPDGQGHWFVISDRQPEYAIILTTDEADPAVVTVLYYRPDAPFTRPTGATP